VKETIGRTDQACVINEALSHMVAC